MATVNYQSLPFEEAIKYFRDKINLPTETYLDIRKEMHTRGFVVAGATKDELLSDLRAAVDKVISEGRTLEDFRKRFDEIVAKHGWLHTGSRDWRSKTIYDTNLRTAYMVGRYKQMTSPTQLKAFPYWVYKTKDDKRVRPYHAAWHLITLRYDDPWWKTHYPLNGWGCRCGVDNITKREYERGKEAGSIKTEAPDDGTYKWKNPQTGEIEEIPNGIDPGWDYNVGEAAWGQKLSNNTMKAGESGWARLSTANWEDYGRQEKIPLDTTATELGKKLSSAIAASGYIEKLIGAKEKVFTFTAGEFTYCVLVNAEALGEHVDLSRSPFLAYLPEVLDNPYEIWLSFEKSTITGKVVLRERLIKGFDTGKGYLIVFQSKNGFMESWTVIPTSDMKYLNNQRVGTLIWKRD